MIKWNYSCVNDVKRYDTSIFCVTLFGIQIYLKQYPCLSNFVATVA